MKILIVEDDQDIAKQISMYLQDCGFITHIESDGEDAWFEGEESDYDAVLLDVGLPSMDGFTILEKWRKKGRTMPVILLTARNSKMEIIKGLELGADDYITKPFDLAELVARLRTNIRKNKGQVSNVISVGPLSLDMLNSRVTKDGMFIKLTRIEFLILQYLFLNQNRTISINELTTHVYEDFDNDSGIVPKHIANIRKKIGHEVIITDSNRGYYVPKDL